ncbi:MAG: exo-alpha-sialidase [Planctomycetaceae bacterium]|nr:exo-alpha-sialidase [Planctomycetaceae bacterium]
MHAHSTGRIVVAIACLVICPAMFAAEPSYHAEDIFPAFDPRGVHVHASAIVVCPNGDLRAVWYANGDELPSPQFYTADRDKHDNVRIMGSRKAKGGDAWEEPFVMNDTFGTSDNNPTLAIDQAGRLWLFHTTMLAAPDWTWGGSVLQYLISTDYDEPGAPVWRKTSLLLPRPLGLDRVIQDLEDGFNNPDDAERSGAPSERLRQYLSALKARVGETRFQRIGWMPRAHPLIRSDGTLILPLSNENFNIPMMALTSDGGQTWTFSNPVPGIGMLQPSLVEFPDGEIHAYFRNSDRRHRIKRSVSTDGGLTWSTPELTDRLHPGGGVEVLLLKSGNLALVYNNKESSPRDKLAIALSTDRGQTWQWERQLEDTPNARFDYPSIAQADDGTIHVSYSWELRTIKHAEFNEEWIQQQAE